MFYNHLVRSLCCYLLVSQLNCSPVELIMSPAKTTTCQWRANEINTSLTLLWAIIFAPFEGADVSPKPRSHPERYRWKRIDRLLYICCHFLKVNSKNKLHGTEVHSISFSMKSITQYKQQWIDPKEAYVQFHKIGRWSCKWDGITQSQTMMFINYAQDLMMP